MLPVFCVLGMVRPSRPSLHIGPQFFFQAGPTLTICTNISVDPPVVKPLKNMIFMKNGCPEAGISHPPYPHGHGNQWGVQPFRCTLVHMIPPFFVVAPHIKVMRSRPIFGPKQKVDGLPKKKSENLPPPSMEVVLRAYPTGPPTHSFLFFHQAHCFQ